MSANKSIKDDKNLSFGERWRWVTESRLVGIVACVIFSILLCSGAALTVMHDRAMAAAMANQVPPNLSVRLQGVEGLDPCASPPAPPAFHLVVDADWIPARYSYRYCSGGGNSMLRVSYHGMILAWGHVPWFCVEGSLTGHGDGVVTVEAQAESALLREELRCLVQGELHVVGKAEFDVEGEVAGLGYLRCKTFLFKDNATGESSLCLVQ